MKIRFVIGFWFREVKTLLGCFLIVIGRGIDPSPEVNFVQVLAHYFSTSTIITITISHSHDIKSLMISKQAKVSTQFRHTFALQTIWFSRFPQNRHHQRHRWRSRSCGCLTSSTTFPSLPSCLFPNIGLSKCNLCKHWLYKVQQCFRYRSLRIWNSIKISKSLLGQIEYN